MTQLDESQPSPREVRFPEEPLRPAVKRTLDRWSAVADRARAQDAPAIERLEYLVRGTVEVLQAELASVTVLRIRGNAEVERAVLERRHAFDRLITDLVEQAERDGDIRAGFDPAITARLLSGMVQSLAEWCKPAGQGIDSALAEEICAIAFDGLRVRGAALPES